MADLATKIYSYQRIADKGTKNSDTAILSDRKKVKLTANDLLNVAATIAKN